MLLRFPVLSRALHCSLPWRFLFCFIWLVVWLTFVPISKSRLISSFGNKPMIGMRAPPKKKKKKASSLLRLSTVQSLCFMILMESENKSQEGAPGCPHIPWQPCRWACQGKRGHTNEHSPSLTSGLKNTTNHQVQAED